MIKRTFAVVSMAIILMSCDVTQKKEGELPEIDIDVDAESGQLPTFDVDWADVNVGTRTKTISVPKVVIVMEEEEVEIPYIDVDMPNDKEKNERTLMVEAEVTDKEHTIEIQEIRASGKKLYVIAELESTDQSLGDKKMRVSDQVSLNAPDLEVKYYIVGERPDRVFNTQHTYFKSMDDAISKMKDYRVVYKK